MHKAEPSSRIDARPATAPDPGYPVAARRSPNGVPYIVVSDINMRLTLKRHALLYSAAGALVLAGTLQAGLVSTINGSGEFLDLGQSFGCSNAGTTTASCDFEAEGVPGTVFDHASGSYQANAQYGSLDATSR